MSNSRTVSNSRSDELKLPGTGAATSAAVPSSRRSIAWTVTIVFAVLILIPSMLGFVMKFRELMALTNDAAGGTEGGFAITPVVNYLLASAGFFFLLLWAAFNGMFRDLEQPKHVMLQNEMELDRNV